VAAPYRYAILDRDAKFDAEVITFLQATGLEAKRTSVEAPWQNGLAERWIGSCRREMLDHVIALNERHLLRLLHEYLRYYYGDRIHDALQKDTPEGRAVEARPVARATVIALPRLGGCIIVTHGGKRRRLSAGNFGGDRRSLGSQDQEGCRR
jgi:hypothetical protein